jgi:hypothetical protein
MIGERDCLGSESIARVSVLQRVLCSLWAPLAVFALLLLPTISRCGNGWDEQGDWFVAQSLQDDWLCGGDESPTQMRLQMYAGAAVARILHTDSGILAGRVLAFAYGAAGIAATWCYGRKRIGVSASAIAAWLLALSPYYLSYSRLAFTESDMLLCALMPVLAIAGTNYLEKRGIGACVATSVILGLAAATKFTAVALVPATIAMLFFVRPEPPAPQSSRLRRFGWIAPAMLCVLLLATGIVGYRLAGADLSDGIASAMDGIARHYERLPRAWKLTHYLCVLSLTLGYCAWGIAYRRERAPTWLGAIVLCTLSAAVFFAAAPAHTCNPTLVHSTIERFLRSRMPSGDLLTENAVLYSLAILFKSSPLIGLALLASPFFQLGRLRSRSALAFPLAIVAFYCAAVMRIDFQQVFYMLPLVPLLCLFVGDMTMRAMRLLPTATKRCAAIAVTLLAVDLCLSIPDYNLNGYQYLGERYICGHSTLGYTCVATIPNDGASQALDWTLTHARPGSRVALYVAPMTVRGALCQSWPDLRFSDGADWFQRLVLRDYDYVVTQEFYEVNEGLGPDRPTGSIRTRAWYDRAELERDFVKVFAVERRFGIEPASVWERVQP